MRRSMKAAAAGTAVTVAMGGAVLAGTTGVQAQDRGRQLTGTWRVVVDQDGEMPPFVSTIAYTSTGSLVESTSRAPSPAGLGTWDRLGGHTFTSTFEKYRFDANGQYVGRVRITEVQTMAADGESYSARATTEIINPQDQVVATYGSVANATRL